MSRDLIIDVESVGLHGEGFAIGWVVLEDAKRVSEGWAACDPAQARGTKEGRDWVAEHVIEPPPGSLPLPKSFMTPTELRVWWWTRIWAPERELDTRMWGDVPWPVEARFLIDCVEDYRPPRPVRKPLALPAVGERSALDLDPSEACWNGPYPLWCVRTYMLAAGMLVTGGVVGDERLADELPEHNPLTDARQSARLLLKARKILEARPLMTTRATHPTIPSEALFAFMGWLTTRDEVSGPFSSGNNAAQAAELVAEYCRRQGWEEPRKGWGDLIVPCPSADKGA